MKAGNYTITVNRGTNLRIPIQWKRKDRTPFDLTGTQISLEITPLSSNPQKITCSTNDGHIIIEDAVNGKFLVNIKPEVIENWTWSRARYTLNIRFSTGDVFPILDGNLIIKSN